VLRWDGASSPGKAYLNVICRSLFSTFCLRPTFTRHKAAHQASVKTARQLRHHEGAPVIKHGLCALAAPLCCFALLLRHFQWSLPAKALLLTDEIPSSLTQGRDNGLGKRQLPTLTWPATRGCPGKGAQNCAQPQQSQRRHSLAIETELASMR
jgi:hypothetical protein